MNTAEETRKAEIAHKYFGNCLYLPGGVKNIDFCIADYSGKWLFWAEAKKNETPLARMLTQLILTIKRYSKGIEPPKWIGMFDSQRICFVPISLSIELLSVETGNLVPSKTNDVRFKTFEKTVSEKFYASKSFLFEFCQEKEIMEFIEKNIIQR